MAKSVTGLTNINNIQEFLANASKLVEEVQNFTLSFGMEISDFKEEFVLFDEFSTVNSGKVKTIIKSFQSFPSNMDALSILDKFGDFKLNTTGITDGLDFDIVGVMVALNRSIVTLTANVQTIEDGSLQVISDFNGVIQAFLDLGDGLSQEYLMKVQDKFETLKSSFNASLKAPI